MNHEEHREHEGETGAVLAESDTLSGRVLGCAIEVHRQLGPGLLESAYRACLAYELQAAGLRFVAEKPIGLSYKGVELDCGFRIDLLVEDSLVIELKTVDRLLPVHSAQIADIYEIGEFAGRLADEFSGESSARRHPAPRPLISSCSSCSLWFNLLPFEHTQAGAQ